MAQRLNKQAQRVFDSLDDVIDPGVWALTPEDSEHFFVRNGHLRIEAEIGSWGRVIRIRSDGAVVAKSEQFKGRGWAERFHAEFLSLMPLIVNWEKADV